MSMTFTVYLWGNAEDAHHIEVEAHVSPGEAPILSGPPDAWYPGSPPEVDISAAWLVRGRRRRELDLRRLLSRDGFYEAAEERAIVISEAAALDAAEARAEAAAEARRERERRL